MEKYQVMQRIRETGIVAIVRGIQEEDILDCANALYDGGIRLIEVTCNTPGYLNMIRKLTSNLSNKMIIGAGTVLNTTTAQLVLEAGAEFVLAPDLNPEVVQLVHQNRKLAIPGITTPSEMVAAYQLGVDVVKLFPAGNFGPSYLKNLRGPFGDVAIMPVGGVNLDNLPGFVKAGACAFGIGGELVNKKAIASKDYIKLTGNAQNFIKTFQNAQNS